MKIEFNNGFITAIALFLEHKSSANYLPRDTNGNLISDLRLYGATDHLYDLEIPSMLSEKLRNRIIKWKRKCFKYRLETLKEAKIADSLFKEGEQILKQIDEEIFKTKRVIMRYR